MRLLASKSMCFYFLLSFGLFVLSSSKAVATTLNLNPGDDLAGTVASANPGDTVLLSAGTYDLSTPVIVPTGVTIMGASRSDTHVVFDLAGGNDTSYGFVISGNASDVTIENLDLVSNHGVLSMDEGSGYQNIVISRNNVQYGGGQFANGTLVFGISGTISNDGLQIIHNYFHDSPGTVRNWSIWFASNANLDYNLFYNINDGGQLDCPGDNVSFSYNYGTNMHRMGQEVYVGSDSTFVCTGNVFYDYVNPYYDTEGVSIVGGTGQVGITNNYFRATLAAGSSWGQADSGGTHRFGYAIESTGAPGTVSGNTVIGTWAEIVSADMTGVSVLNNSVFGYGLWGNFEGEPGHEGFGSVVVGSNAVDKNTGDAPAPPVNLYAGPRKHSM